LTFCKST